MTKADKIRAYVSKHPNARPKEVAKATKASYGYAYKIIKEEQANRATAQVVNQHVTETTESLKPKRTMWQRLMRKLAVQWGRLVKKFMRVVGLYEK